MNNAKDEYLSELISSLSNPVHKRLLQAYRTDDPSASMEAELSKILYEVLRSENK